MPHLLPVLALVLGVLAAACASPAPQSPAVPRGAQVLGGPSSGTGSADVGSYRLVAGESVGTAIACRGPGRVWLEDEGVAAGQDPLHGVEVYCRGGGGGGGSWVQPTDRRGTLHVVARRGTRWRVVLYRAPVPLDDPTPSTSPSTAATTP